MKLPAPIQPRFFKDTKTRLESSDLERWFRALDARFSNLATLENWENAILEWNEIKSHIETHFSKASLAFHQNTKNLEIEAEEKRLHEEIDPPYKEWSALIRQKVLAAPERKRLEQRFGALYFLQLKLQQDAFSKENIALETEIHDLLSNYTKLTGSAEIEVAGERYPISFQAKFATSADPKSRRESFESASGWYLKNRDALEEIFESCVEKRARIAEKLGQPNYIPVAYQKMGRIDYGPKEVEQFRRQIFEELVPLVSKLQQRQAAKLGQSHLAVWDKDFFKDWNVQKLKVGIDEQVPAALRVYQRLSPRLAAHFKEMIDRELIDVPARSGKAPGGFCTDFADFRVPFIFLNSVGEASDINTLLHESGHAFNAWESREIDLLELRSPTLEACEVHSMGMEFLAHPYYEEFFSKEDAGRYRKFHLAESLIFLPYMAMIDEFQHQIYSGETKGPEGRAKTWEDLEKKYLPGLDFRDLSAWRRHRWMRQLHLFYNPFYYIDYGIALVGALQLWMRSTENADQALEDYLKLCKLGGTKSLCDFFKEVKLELPFEQGMLKDLIAQVLKTEDLFS